MTLVINGESRSIPPIVNVAQLLDHLQIGQDRIAVEVNHKIVKRIEWQTTRLQNSDKVEIVQFVGGG
jgi:sulfur carrier protein